MKLRTLTMLSVIALTSCGRDTTVIHDYKEVPQPYISEELAGYYELPNNGYIEILALNDGRVRIELQQLMTENGNDTLALLPTLSVGPHTLMADGSLVIATSLTYTPSVNNMKEDSNNVDISGSKRTEVVISKNNAGRLVVEITIKNGISIVNPVIVSRSIESIN